MGRKPSCLPIRSACHSKEMALHPPMKLSSEYSRLLCDVAPELGLRGILRDCSASSPSPELYRALISTLLRASTCGVADSAYEVLCAASVASAPARLGLTHLTPPSLSQAVLHDLVSSLIREEPLGPENPALNFYSNAGIGASDPEEFDAPPEEGLAPEFGEGAPPLAEIRRRSLRLTIRYFAAVVQQTAAGATKDDAPMRVGDTKLWACLVDDLSMNVGRVHEDTLGAAQEFFSAALLVESEHERTEIITRLVNAFQNLAANQPESLLLYIATLHDASVKFQACVTYLRQRFGTGGKDKCDEKTLKVERFVRDFLEVKVIRGRVNAVLPAVITGIAQAWLVEASPDCFNVSGSEACVARLGKRLQERKERMLEKCQPNKRDEAEFLLVVMAIIARVLVANGAGR